ncbi:MAG: RNA polymerase sigma factor SigZ [Pirellulales bacterium]
MTAPAQSSEKVWTELSGDLWRFIRNRVADDHMADDLLQETFVRIHRGIDTLSQQDRLAAWVYQIARNVVNDYYRKAAVATVTLGEVDPVEPAADTVASLRCQSGQWLEELIGQLPEIYRDALRLAELEGLTQHQVAQRMGLSLSGAKSRIQRGRALLKADLERCCRFEFDRRGNLTDVEPLPDRTVCRDCDP